MNALDANFYEVHPNLNQTPHLPQEGSVALYGAGFLHPTDSRANWRKPYSPLLKYSWDATEEALTRASRVSDGSPYDGIIMDYANPLTGGPVMPTIGASAQMLRPGERTRAHRHTGSFVYQVAKGSGYSVIEGVRYDWTERDIFVVPSWAAHEHANASDRDPAFLFCFHDLPVMRSLGIYREAALDAPHQTVIRTA
jgi:gentisate 1,2-dioxygenase